MYKFLNYEVRTESKNNEFREELVSELNLKEEDGVLKNDEDNVHYSIELLWDYLKKVVEKYPSEVFIIKGVFDTSTSAGELLDFCVMNDGVKLRGQCSDWYVPEEKCFYDDWEDFLDQCSSYDTPPLSKKEFDNWDDSKILYSIGEEKWVDHIDLNYDIVEYFGLK